MENHTWFHNSKASNNLSVPDYLINESKLLPRLAAIYDMSEDDLDYTWSRGNYLIRSRTSRDKTFDKLEKVSNDHK